jgi:hypothetical protein
LNSDSPKIRRLTGPRQKQITGCCQSRDSRRMRSVNSAKRLTKIVIGEDPVFKRGPAHVAGATVARPWGSGIRRPWATREGEHWYFENCEQTVNGYRLIECKVVECKALNTLDIF